MPLVRIDITAGKSVEYRRALLRGVRNALTETIGVPDARVMQRVVSSAPEDLDLPKGRRAEFTIVDVTLLPGRSAEKKKRLVEAIRTNLGASPGIHCVDIAVILRERSEKNLCILSPADETPPDETPSADETLPDETPPDETPPTDETPPDETPSADETLPDETPGEDEPAEDAPAGDAARDGGS